MPAIIETEKLARSFGPNRVVDGLELRVEAGEIFGLLGPNGAGKTTTIRMLTTLLAPTSGTARVCGFDIGREAREVRKRVGYVMQEVPMALYALTARERVEMEASLYHVPRANVSERATAVLDVVGLLGDADRRFRTFSGGMQKRLDLACGMLHEPQLLVLDEPTLGLDVQSRHNMWEYIRGLQSRGVSVLLATNYLDEADRLCDRLTIIDNGKMVVTGVPAALKRTVGADVVQVSSQSEEALLQALAPEAWVLRSAGNGAGDVTVHVADGAAAVPAIMRVATEAGLILDRITYSQPTLDDVFLLHTGHELRPTE